ncbi:MAG TPA: hypothetical protein VGW39_17425 [Chthoniobacterales bacterium]|nr:hypothetical protein [Chthoniobacterales bacterium]
MVYRASLMMLGVLACAFPGAATTPERSVSTSRQFLVYGPDIKLRSAICDLAERTKGDLLQIIGRRDEWTTPIVIYVQHRQANLPETPRARLNFSQTGFGLKLQLDLTLAPDAAQPEIRRELLGALLLEMMYRGAPDLSAGTTYLPPPDWLLDGLQARNGSRPDALATSAAAQKILPLEEFLQQRPGLLDASGRSLYGAYSMALVEFLTQMPDGRQRLARYISDLPSASNDAMADLRRHFPELIDANGRSNNIWISHITRVAARQTYQLLSWPETERMLHQMLSVRISNRASEKKYRLHEFSAFVREPSARSALTRLDRDLNAFAARAHPLYRPVIREYEKIAARLARGKTHGVAERLARLVAARQRMAAQMQMIDDYLNWFEATQARAPSGAFADYLKAADSAVRLEQRRDPISVYVDFLEVQFQN